MSTAEAIAPTGHWQTTPEEARQWGIKQWETAKSRHRFTQGYFPRYKQRHLGLDGKPVESHVKVASTLVTPPARVVHAVMRQAQAVLAPFMETGKIRFLDRGIVHVTHHAIYPGADAAEDEAKIAVAREVAPRLDGVARQFSPMVLTMDGLTITDRQLMVTYRGDDGWNSFLESAAELEEQIPAFWNAYDLKRSPLQEGGRALNTTLAVFDEGIDMSKLADAVEPFLPGGVLEPQAFLAKDLRLVLQEFDPSYVQRFTETLAHSTFRAPLSAEVEKSHTARISTAPFVLPNDLGRC